MVCGPSSTMLIARARRRGSRRDPGRGVHGCTSRHFQDCCIHRACSPNSSSPSTSSLSSSFSFRFFAFSFQTNHLFPSIDNAPVVFNDFNQSTPDSSYLPIRFRRVFVVPPLLPPGPLPLRPRLPAPPPKRSNVQQRVTSVAYQRLRQLCDIPMRSVLSTDFTRYPLIATVTLLYYCYYYDYCDYYYFIFFFTIFYLYYYNYISSYYYC